LYWHGFFAAWNMVYNKEALDRIRDLLMQNKQTVAVAESVTAGHLQAALSNATDAACFFQGGITAYNLGQKCRQLRVEPIQALECNCVSEKVSEQMAREVSRMFLSDYGIAVTGYATPVPEKGIEELFAYLCIVKGEKTLLTKKLSPGKAKAFDAQVTFANSILVEFINILNG
jgi:nicotinamide-nucleotide amidase